MDDLYVTAAQVLPTLVIAVLFSERQIPTGQALPDRTSANLLLQFLVVAVVGEAAALYAIARGGAGSYLTFAVLFALAVGGLALVLPVAVALSTQVGGSDAVWGARYVATSFNRVVLASANAAPYLPSLVLLALLTTFARLPLYEVLVGLAAHHLAAPVVGRRRAGWLGLATFTVVFLGYRSPVGLGVDLAVIVMLVALLRPLQRLGARVGLMQIALCVFALADALYVLLGVSGALDHEFDSGLAELLALSGSTLALSVLPTYAVWKAARRVRSSLEAGEPAPMAGRL